MAIESESAVHDSTIHSLYGVGLRLEHSLELMDESPADARAMVNDAIGSLEKLIEEIRSRIYELGR